MDDRSGMSAPALPAMVAVTVNYRTAALAIESLQSLAAEVAFYPGLTAIVVDNDSRDGSAEAIAAAIAANGWTWARLIRAPVNGGFAYGNNLAIRSIEPSDGAPALFWLLNPDTQVLPGAARSLACFMRDHPHAGIAGSGILQEDGTPWPYAFRFPTLLGEVERGIRFGPVTRLLARHATLRRMRATPEPVDWVSGASMVVRRALFDAVGGMDEGYFLYFEETDFCLHARRAGWGCWYVPEAVVRHLAGKSTGVTGRQAAERRVPRYWFESRRRYFIKNHGRGYAIATDLLWAITHLLWRARRGVQRLPDTDPPALLRDFVRNSALLAGLGAGNPAKAGRTA